MPRLSVWLIRAALIHMGSGFFFGALLLSHKGIPFYAMAWRLLNVHSEIMIFGWVMQFVMGIAFRVLPRFSTGRRYGREKLGWFSFVLLNGGVGLAASGFWFNLSGLVVIGRLSTLCAVLLFVVMIWPRVKPLGGFAASQRPLK